MTTDRSSLSTLPGAFGKHIGAVADRIRGFLTSLTQAYLRHRQEVQVLGYTAALTVGITLRFIAMDRLGLNSDEAVYTGQAATLAGVPGFAEDFSIFRAHPLLYQYTLSLIFRIFGFSEMAGRMLSAVFGVATLYFAYLIGKHLAGRTAGWLAAIALGVMPFHIIVARQALLESPMTLFYAASVYALLRYFDALDDESSTRTARWGWAFAIGSFAGLSFMSKEVAVILLGVVFVATTVTRRFKFGHSLIMTGAFAITVLPHLLALKLGPASEGGGGWAEYVIWQVARPANHPVTFYLNNSLVYFGLPMLILLGVGLWMAARRMHSRPDLVAILVATVVPVWFFQVWKVKGFHYPVVIGPLAAALVAWVLVTWWRSNDKAIKGAVAILTLVTIASMAWVSAVNGPIRDNSHRIGTAGYSGIPGGREAAVWLAENVPDGSRILGIGPSIGNIVRWYSDHQTSALSISPNPLRANPAYEAVRNPDFELRWGLVEYLIYDAYSADRTPHFANRLLDFVETYGGEIVHEEFAPLIGEDGREYLAPVIRVYRVGPVGIDPTPVGEPEEE